MMATPLDTQEETKRSAKPKGSFGGLTCVYGSKNMFEDARHANKGRSSRTELAPRSTKSLPPPKRFHSKPSQWILSSAYHQTAFWIQSSPLWTTAVPALLCSSHVLLRSQPQR